jgi:D123
MNIYAQHFQKKTVMPTMPPSFMPTHKVLLVVLDVYIDKERSKVWLVDFNPFGPVTDGLLFSWEEIYNQTDGPVDFRIINSEGDVRLSAASSSRFPIDVMPGVVNLSNAGGIDSLVSMMRNDHLELQ